MKNVLRWGPVIVWMGIIFYLSHQPATSLEKMLPYFNRLFPSMQSFNWGHFLAYFILGLCMLLALGSKFNHWKGKIVVVIVCTLYGITDEVHQLYVEGRHFDVADIRNDAIGAALAMLFVSIPSINRLYIKLSNYCEK